MQISLNIFSMFVSKLHFITHYFTHILKYKYVKNIFVYSSFKLFLENEKIQVKSLEGKNIVAHDATNWFFFFIFYKKPG